MLVVTACGGADNPNAFGPTGTPPGAGGTVTSGSGGSQTGLGGAIGPGATTGAGGIVGAGGASGPGGSISTGGGAANGGEPPDASLLRADGGTPVVYPPLDFAAIGKPVSIDNQFLFTEGPVWDPAKAVLYFTDINADTVYRLTLPSQFDVLLSPSGKPDGLALDPQGRLIAAGFVSRDIWRLDGTTMTALASAYQGKKLNSPDDLVARSDGVIYFTDPVFGINGSQGLSSQTQEQSFQGVYRLTTDGTLYAEDQTTSAPNGVGLSPDERTLYVSYTSTGQVASFSVAADGSLSGKTTFATGIAIADSMTVDAGGNVYVASLNGIAVLDPTGQRLGTIPVGQVPTNAAFGGPDQRTLFITARTGLLGTPTKGNASLYRIDNMPVPGMPGRP